MNYPQTLCTDAFLDNAFAFYGTISKDGTLKKVRGRILETLDLEAQFLVGREFAELVIWQADALNVDSLKHALRRVDEKGVAKVSLSFRARSHQLRHVDMTLYSLGGGEDPDEDIFFCATDVTTRVREVDFYKERSEHFLFAAESAGIGLWFWDLEKDEIFSTPKCNQIFDLAPHDIITRDYFLNLVHPDDREETERKLAEAQREGKEYNAEYRVIHSDGNTQWVAASGMTFFDEDGHPVSMMGSVRRITDDKMAAEELERIYILEKKSREAAIQANKAKDYFLALVSHELRSPLNSILGWTQILRKKEIDREAFDRALETIEHSAKSQAKLIEDLVDSARVTSGKLKLELRPVNLFDVVRKAVTLQQPTAEEKNIDLEFDHDAEEIEVFGDFMRLQQIFNNLLTNSIKFTPEGGRVGVELTTDGKEVRVIIKDNGQGISETDLPLIFNAFAQGDNTTTRDKKGLGLGLSIAKILTDKQEGRINVESEGIGKGATFTVTFPLYVETEADLRDDVARSEEMRREGLSAEEMLRNVSILVVEDDEDSRNVLELYLEQIGARVISAESVQTAFKALNRPENSFDVIVSDLAMPEEDGYSFMKKVRASSEYGRIPAIALSAFTADKNKREAFEAGFQKYHTKPFEPDLLIEEIAELVHREKKNGEAA